MSAAKNIDEARFAATMKQLLEVDHQAPLYVSTFYNEHGEPWIFYVDSDEARDHVGGTLIGSETDWEHMEIGTKVELFPVSGTTVPSVARVDPDVPDEHHWILDRPEAEWLGACLLASTCWRYPPPRQVTESST